MNKTFIDITNQKFGRLLVLYSKKIEGKKPMCWVCKCDCGKETIVVGKSLRRGVTKSCGCLKKENIIKSNKKRKGIHFKNGKYFKYKYLDDNLFLKNKTLIERYNITLEDYNKLLEKQNELCKICGRKKRLAIDHCHKTNKIRGLLCYKCNNIVSAYENYKDIFPLVEKYLIGGN